MEKKDGRWKIEKKDGRWEMEDGVWSLEFESK
jgi:hypothetical protein